MLSILVFLPRFFIDQEIDYPRVSIRVSVWALTIAVLSSTNTLFALSEGNSLALKTMDYYHFYIAIHYTVTKTCVLAVIL